MTLYVAAGDSGKLATSPDGVTWTQRTSTFGTLAIYGIAYGNGKWVAVGRSGHTATSSDGITWTAGPTLTVNYLYGVAYGNGTWVTVSDSGYVYTSPDGVTWTQQAPTPIGVGTSLHEIYSVAYGEGRFVAGYNSGMMYSTDNGVTWNLSTNSLSSSSAVYGMAYGGAGYFFAVADNGEAEISADGSAFGADVVVPASSHRLQAAAISDNGIYVGVGGEFFGGYASLVRSSGGSSWAYSNTAFGGVSSQFMFGVTWGSSLFVAVGANSSAGVIYTSTDGATWTQRTSSFGATGINAVAASVNSIPDSVGVLIG